MLLLTASFGLRIGDTLSLKVSFIERLKLTEQKTLVKKQFTSIPENLFISLLTLKQLKKLKSDDKLFSISYA